MYYITKIYKDHTDNAWKASATKYKQAYDNAAIVAKADPAIVSMLIFSDGGTALIVKRENLLKYGANESVRSIKQA